MEKKYTDAMNQTDWLNPIVNLWLSKLTEHSKNLQDLVNIIQKNLTNKHTEIKITEMYIQLINSEFVIPNKYISKKWKMIIEKDILPNPSRYFKQVSISEDHFVFDKFLYNGDINADILIENIKKKFINKIINIANTTQYKEEVTEMINKITWI